MTILAIVQQFCARTGIPVPATVLGTTDKQVRQIRALLEEEGQDLSRRGSWEGITCQASWTTVALEDQGAITTIASNGYNYIKNNTIWDRTTRLPVCGPVSGVDWQILKAYFVSGPRYRYRLRQGHMLVNPAPPASDAWYFEYASKNWILGVDGTTYKDFFTLDTDDVLLPNDLIIMGLRWRWKKEKGFDYSEDFRTYEMQVKDALGRDGGKPPISMNHDQQYGPQPGVFVPVGTWDV